MPKKKNNKPKNNQPKKKLPSVWRLTKQTYIEAVTFRRSLFGILAVYAVLYFVLVLSLNFSGSLQGNFATNSSRLNDAINSVLNQFVNGSLIGSGTSDTPIIIQFLLFLIGSMAFVWALRKLQKLQKIKIREAYYLGSSALVTTIIITVVLLLTFIPALIGSSILPVALQSGAAGLEILTVTIISLLLLILSLYLFVMLWPAFYIVSLPKTMPWQALKSAAKLTKKNRFNIMRKIFMLFVILIFVIFIILFPIALVLPSIVPIVAYILIFIAFGLAHVYLYMLYRSLL